MMAIMYECTLFLSFKKNVQVLYLPFSDLLFFYFILWQVILNQKDISERKYICEIYMGVIAFIISKILCMLKCYTIAKIIIWYTHFTMHSLASIRIEWIYFSFDDMRIKSYIITK